MSIRLIILGLLQERNYHPYEIRQTIKARNWHYTFRIRDGSLYYAVDQMHEDGLIEVAETIAVQGGNRPDKLVYRITDKGKATFQELIYGELGESFVPQHPMFAALPFARHADDARMAGIIAKQLEACLTRIAHLREVLSVKGGWLPRGAVRLIEGILSFNETERAWLEGLLEDARSGRLTDEGNVPEQYRK
jgi:DNA-binding PadR family transcriptional regulator